MVFSALQAMAAMVRTAVSGNFPLAVSPNHGWPQLDHN